MARAQGARAQMALAFETVYGTAPASGYTRIPFASTSLGSEQPLIASELLGYGRDPSAPIKDAVTADGDVVVPIDAEAFGFWLKAAFGDPVTTGTGPFTHEFRSGSFTLPSLSIETAMPEVPRYAMYSGCVLDQLSWQMQRSGLLTATAKLVAQGETVGTTTAAGTPAEPALKRFGHFNGTITRNGSALGNVVSAEITYANNLDRIETIRSDGKIDGADPSIAALTGRVEVRFADQVLVDQAIAGDPCELEFGYALPSGESFTFTVHAVYLPRPRIEIAGPQGCRRPSTGRRRGTPAWADVHGDARQRCRDILASGAVRAPRRAALLTCGRCDRGERREIEAEHCAQGCRAPLESAAQRGALPAIDQEIGHRPDIDIRMHLVQPLRLSEADGDPLGDRGEATFDLLAEHFARGRQLLTDSAHQAALEALALIGKGGRLEEAAIRSSGATASSARKASSCSCTPST